MSRPTDPLAFGDFPPEYRDPRTARVVLLPVPYDRTSTWIKGADCGPEAILRTSPNLEFYDMETDSEVYLHGIHTDSPVKVEAGPEELAREVKRRAAHWLDQGKFPVILGGEHSVSIGMFEALAERKQRLTVLQLDAHADTRQSYEGSPYNHACVMARAREHFPIVQVGIRSMDAAEKASMDPSHLFPAHRIMRRDRREWIAQVVERLEDEVYLTIDLDVFDSSLMPATGTPEPGGLGWYDVIDLIKAVAAAKTIVGFDVVELCPRPELWACDFLAARLVYQVLTIVFASSPTPPTAP